MARSSSLLFAACLLGTASGLAHAQQLVLKREPPRIQWSGCPAITAPEAGDAQQVQHAEQLAARATEAAILGDNAAALEHLTQAVALAPHSAALSYRRARALETLDRGDEAVAEYCRYLALPGATDVAEVEQRLAELTGADQQAVPAAAAHAYEAGIEQYDAGSLQLAEASFADAHQSAPDWSAPVFNRAIVRMALGRQDAAAEDLRTYLEMSPGASDFDVVLDLLSTIRGSTSPDPLVALATGLVVPGLGHFTTGRPVRGAVILGSATGALAVGLLTQRTEVDCLAVPVDGRCPPDQILRERVERPYLTAAIAVAAAIGIGGAIDAYRSARSRGDAAPALLRLNGQDGAALEVPGLYLDGDGARLDLLRLRF